MKPILRVTKATLESPGGRVLFAALDLSLGQRDRVAVVGRNGVGKSTLLAALAGHVAFDRGECSVAAPPHWVPQLVDDEGDGSPGEKRRARLDVARRRAPEVLLLDEPTLDLDDDAVAWLRAWLRTYDGCLVVVSHDPRLLADFGDFLVVGESGCRHFAGTFDALVRTLGDDERTAQARYASTLRRLAAEESHTEHVARRKARKKRYGRASELDRATPRIRLNAKRSDAQNSHGRLAALREARRLLAREQGRAMRTSLAVHLAIAAPMPRLAMTPGDVVVLHGVAAVAHGRTLFRDLDLRIAGERVGVLGPNGTGKSTLLAIARGTMAPTAGRARVDTARVAGIAQGARDWRHEDSLASLVDGVALARSGFPSALAMRSLRSLSAGERTRAALLALHHRASPPQLLVLDEPTASLDQDGMRDVIAMLRAWPGALLIATHDVALLDAVAIDDRIVLGGAVPARRERQRP